jgi:hypothetical protein
VPASFPQALHPLLLRDREWGSLADKEPSPSAANLLILMGRFQFLGRVRTCVLELRSQVGVQVRLVARTMTEAIGTARIRDLQIAVTELARPDSIPVTERDATSQQDPVEQDGGVGTHPQLHSRRHRRRHVSASDLSSAAQFRGFTSEQRGIVEQGQPASCLIGTPAILTCRATESCARSSYFFD